MANVTATFKADPLTFLQANATTCAAGGANLGTRYLKLVDGGPMVQMVNAQADEERASFYVLGWAENAVATGQLGNNADYFYTGPLSGCMFAVDKNWYTPRVVHVNQLTQNQQMDVNGMRGSVNQVMANATSWLRWSYTPNITVVESHNRQAEHRYSIFGWRGKLGWTFVQQTVNLDTMAVVSVEKLDNWF